MFKNKTLIKYIFSLLLRSDAASVDAVSRIGATSIGEVSLSVASGSHLGAISQYTAFVQPSNRESTTALAGSITGYVIGFI